MAAHFFLELLTTLSGPRLVGLEIASEVLRIDPGAFGGLAKGSY